MNFIIILCLNISAILTKILKILKLLIKAKDGAERLQILLEEGVALLGKCQDAMHHYFTPFQENPQTTLWWNFTGLDTSSFIIPSSFLTVTFIKKNKQRGFFISSIFPLIKKLGLKILSQARRSSTVDGGEAISEIEASNTMYTSDCITHNNSRMESRRVGSSF